MKKVFSVLMAAVCAFSLIGCTGTDTSKKDEKSEQVKIVCDGLTDEAYAIGVNKDEQELLGQINDFIAEVSENGKLDEIINRYLEGGEAQMVTSAKEDASKDQLLVASTLDFEPFEYGKIGEYYGIDMEIIKELADYLGKELVIVDSSFETMFMSVNQHKCQICIGGISITPEREELVDFTTPYFQTGQCLVTRSDNKEFDSADSPDKVQDILKEKGAETIIGVENLTTAQEFCEGEGEYEGFSMTVRGYHDIRAAIDGLKNGECEYVIGDYVSTRGAVDVANGEE